MGTNTDLLINQTSQTFIKGKKLAKTFAVSTQ